MLTIEEAILFILGENFLFQVTWQYNLECLHPGEGSASRQCLVLIYLVVQSHAPQH